MKSVKWGLIGMWALGVVMGWGGARWVLQARRSPKHMEERILKQLVSEVKLDEAQQTAVRSILQEARKTINTLKEDQDVKIDTAIQSMRKRIQGELRSDQMAAYERWIQNRDARRKKMRERSERR